MKFLEWMDLDRGIQNLLIKISKSKYKYEEIQVYAINIFQTHIQKMIIS